MSQFTSAREKRKARQRRKAALFALCAFIVAGVALTYWRTRRPPPPVPLPDLARPIVEARNAAQYDRALRLVAEGLRNNPGAATLESLSEELQRNLKTDIIEMHYLKHGALPARRPGPGSPLQLTADDEFYFTVNLLGVPRPCYV